MKKAVSNTTGGIITLGGVSIQSKTQRIVRESLISEDEKKALKDSGLVVSYGFSSICVAETKKEVTDVALSCRVYHIKG